MAKITPVGKKKSFKKFKNTLGWTFLTKPKGECGEVLLESGDFINGAFIVDDFGLDNPHAWKRRF